jgi:CRP-like cAMP-binding protein
MKSNPLHRKLSTDRWYRACPGELQAALVRLSRPIRLNDGEELFQRGDGDVGLYCVLDGALLISNVNDDGRMAVLSQVEPCQWFGEIATLDQGPRHFSAHANGNTEVLFVPGEALVPWLNLHPLCWRDIGILACSKLRVALDAIQEISFLSLEQRILRRLERIASGYGSRVSPSKRVKVSQEVIAQMMGVSRQSANKAMKTLEELGLISRNYGVVELHNKSHNRQSTNESVQVEVIVRRFKRDEQGPETVF